MNEANNMSSKHQFIDGNRPTNDDLTKEDAVILREKTACSIAWSIELGHLDPKSVRGTSTGQATISKRECAIILVKNGISKKIADFYRETYSFSQPEIDAHSGHML